MLGEAEENNYSGGFNHRGHIIVLREIFVVGDKRTAFVGTLVIA